MERIYRGVTENFIVETKELLANIEANIEKLLEIENKTYDNFFNEMELEMEKFSEFSFPIEVETSTAITDLGKKTYETLIPLANEFEAKISQNEDIAAAINAIYKNETLTPVRKRILEKRILSLKSSGIGLDEKTKEKINEINLRLSQLSNDFGNNVTDATNEYELIIKDEKVLDEFSKLDKKSAEVGDGTWKFTLHGPSFVTFMKFCNNKELREELYKAYTTRAPQNGKLIEEILNLKDEKAKILGFKNFRELSVASKTANNADEVVGFLKDLGMTALPAAKKETEELEKFAKEELGLEKYDVFDTSYVSRKLKEAKYSFDPSSVKPYFEVNKVLDGMFSFLDTTFSLKSTKVEDTKLWNDKALVYKLERNNQLLGHLILDLETNDVKQGGAWANKWTTSHDIDGKRVPSIGIIVCNFPASKNGVPSLLDHSDVVTLFHEMGHALHNLTSQVGEISASGFNGTEWDVVEYPSQWFQEFASNRAIIKTFAKHYETNEVIPDELVDAMLESEKFGVGNGNNRQVEFGLFDMSIYDGPHYTEEEVQAKLEEVRNLVSPMKTPDYVRFQNSFSHIFAGGYSAGYYSYKWAEVLSADSYLEMTKGGVVNKELANNFFDNLLSLGGSVNMKESFVKVHNRQPDPKALLKLTGIL